MGVQSLNMFCYRCGIETGHVKKNTSHLLHFFIGLFTLGFWWIVWILIAALNSGAPKCARCGTAYSQRLAVQTAAQLDSNRQMQLGRLGQ